MRILDEHGQPPRRFYVARVEDRAIHEMLGLVKGIVCDGIVTNEECQAFARWLNANPDATSAWPGKVLARRILEVFADGTVEATERHDLYELFCDTVGDGGNAESLAQNYSTRLPFDDPAPQITFAGRTFVLTGQFIFGSRARCEREIASRDGRCHATVVKQPHTLVVGTIASRSWIQSDWGRKIEKAVQFRDAGVGVQIVSEETWLGAL
jgi:NAD-dependent DNA ligase